MRHYQIYAGGHVCGSLRIWLCYVDSHRGAATPCAFILSQEQQQELNPRVFGDIYVDLGDDVEELEQVH